MAEAKAEATAPPTLLLIGGGNAVHCITGLVGKKYTVKVLTMPREVELLRDATITVTNDLGPDYVGHVDAVSSEPKDVVPGAAIILFAVPATYHFAYLKVCVLRVIRNLLLVATASSHSFSSLLRVFLQWLQKMGPFLSEGVIIGALPARGTMRCVKRKGVVERGKGGREPSD
jgi:hypothetical protein